MKYEETDKVELKSIIDDLKEKDINLDKFSVV